MNLLDMVEEDSHSPAVVALRRRRRWQRAAEWMMPRGQ